MSLGGIHHRAARIAVVTGSRAEFGLLAPVMRAIRSHESLELLTVVAGAHYLMPAMTSREVESSFRVDASVPMQNAEGPSGRAADAVALGRGVSGFATTFGNLQPSAVVVLGDRIEAFAAASAASIAGTPVVHIHGGDRAEGIADEAMRHAITKLAHIHFAATASSALRIIRMGEPAERVHQVGSPAIDGLEHVEPMPDDGARELGDPRVVLLLHPAGLAPDAERATARRVCEAIVQHRQGRSGVLVLSPNHDPGRGIITEVFTMFTESNAWRQVDHLPRATFLSLLKRLSVTSPTTQGVLVGNSSAGLIEAAALRVPVVNVLECPDPNRSNLGSLLARAGAMTTDDVPASHPYGDGAASRRIADLLAGVDLADEKLIRKRNSY